MARSTETTEGGVRTLLSQMKESLQHRRQLGSVLIVTVSLLTFFGFWQAGSVLLPRMLPSPIEVFETTIEILTTEGPRGNTGVEHLWVSLRRSLTVLAMSLTISVVIGVLMGIYPRVESVISTWLPFWMTSPDVVVILLVMIIVGFTGTSIVIAVIVTTTPFGIVNMWQGTKDLDSELLEMARAFDSDSLLVWRYVYIPHLFPYIFASSRYMLGMTWKVVLVGEAFGTSTGMGAIIRFWFSIGAISEILAYLSLFVVVIFVIEYLIYKPIQNRLFAWRA